MRFRLLNKDAWFDYKEANKVTEGLDVLKEKRADFSALFS